MARGRAAQRDEARQDRRPRTSRCSSRGTPGRAQSVASPRPHRDARRGALGVGEARRARAAGGPRAVGGRRARSPRARCAARDELERRRVLDELDAGGPGQGRARPVVVGRPEPAADDHRRRRARPRTHGARRLGRGVADERRADVTRAPARASRPPSRGRCASRRCAREQLVADDDERRPRAVTCRSGCARSRRPSRRSPWPRGACSPAALSSFSPPAAASLVVGVDLGAHEAAREVGVDLAGGLDGASARPGSSRHGPRPRPR